jgi:hypothetical protein
MVAAFLGIAFLAGLPAVVHAGMPTVNLTDAGRMRLDSLSFFAVGFLLSAWGIRSLWNLLQRDFPRLPRLTFKAAAGVVFLWGMLFVLVLTMISGARELMTPGAWEKQGLTYKLADANAVHSVAAGLTTAPREHDALARRRAQQLQNLHVALLAYAARHDGQYPSVEAAEGIGAEIWNLPDRLGARYLYVPGGSVVDVSEVVAYEPLVYDDRQFVLWTDGRIQPMSVAELQTALDARSTP